MDETVLVLMLKNKETGILEKEVVCCRVTENENLIYNAFASEEEDGSLTAHIRLTCDRNVLDWEYSAIYDYYETDALLSVCARVNEAEGCFNPAWEAELPLVENIPEMEEKIALLLEIHKKELYSVYEAIIGKEEEYDVMPEM